MGMLTNQLKTVVFLGLLTGLLLWVGSFWGPQGLTFAVIFVVLMNFITYFFSDKMVLAMYRAREVPKNNSLYRLVADVAKKAGLPAPRVYIVPVATPNAFATGRGPNHAAVACTEGILKLLSKDELQGVIAHELSHVKNRDVLIATIAATLAGIIGYVAQMAQWSMMFGNRNSREGRNNIISLLILVILTPIIATMIRLAISRSREYMADASGASIVKDSRSLARALEKIHAGIDANPLRGGNKATASLFIENPFRGEALISLFSTHPDVNDRIKRLEAMKF